MRTARFQANTSSDRIDRVIDAHHPLSADQKKNIVIIGASGHAEIIIDILRQEGRFNILGLLDQSRKTGEKVQGCPVLGKEEDLPELITSHILDGVIIAIGDNSARSRVVDRIKKITPELPFFSFIHPRASIAEDVSIGEGTVVMAGASIGPSCSIGRFCILNTNSSLHHNSVLKNFASLASRATTGNNCRIGEYSKICTRVTLIDGINIGKQTVIGAGSLVTKHLKSFVVAYGTPAKIIRKRNLGAKRLRVVSPKRYSVALNFLSSSHSRQQVAANPSPLEKTLQTCLSTRPGMNKSIKTNKFESKKNQCHITTLHNVELC